MALLDRGYQDGRLCYLGIVAASRAPSRERLGLWEGSADGEGEGLVGGQLGSACLFVAELGC
jgi:hypothetical protein